MSETGPLEPAPPKAEGEAPKLPSVPEPAAEPVAVASPGTSNPADAAPETAEQKPVEPVLPSTWGTRWGAPLLVIASGSLLGLWILSRLPQGPEYPLLRRLGLIFGLPLVALCLLVGVRLSTSNASRGGDLIITWLTTFLVALQILLIGSGSGIFGPVEGTLPVASGMLFLGLGASIWGLEQGSAFGLRLRVTLDDPNVWRKAHRALGLAFAVAGLASFLGVFLPITQALILLCAAPLAAFLVGLLTAYRLGAKTPKA